MTTSITCCMSPPRARAAATTPTTADRAPGERRIAEGFAFQGETMPYRDAPRGGRAPAAAGRLRRLHPESRPDRQPRLWRTADLLGSAGGVRALAASTCSRRKFRCCSWARNGARRQPFPFFCDFSGELAEAVSKGRREEFSRFPEFADPADAAKHSRSMAESTFLAAKLDWRSTSTHLAFTALS